VNIYDDALLMTGWYGQEVHEGLTVPLVVKTSGIGYSRFFFPWLSLALCLKVFVA
jgi:hypothetical protein